MASTDGTSSDVADGGTTAARRRARTAAEQREERGTTSEDPQEIAAQIERTREELAETFDAIADKVSPKRVADRTKKKVADSVKDGAEKSAATVKAGAAQLLDAVVEKKEALQDKVAGTSEPAETVGGSGDAGGLGAPPLHAVPAAPDYPAGGLRLGPPAVAGAAAALLVAVLLLRRRRSSRRRWPR